MINFVLDFLQNNLFIILLALSLVILFSFAFKVFRRIIYGSGIVTLITFSLAVLGRYYSSFTVFSIYFQRFIISVTKILEIIGQGISNNKNIFSSLVSLGNDGVFKPFYQYDTFNAYNTYYISNEFMFIFNKIKLEISTKIVFLKEELIKKINLSKNTFAYRL